MGGKSHDAQWESAANRKIFGDIHQCMNHVSVGIRKDNKTSGSQIVEKCQLNCSQSLFLTMEPLGDGGLIHRLGLCHRYFIRSKPEYKVFNSHVAIRKKPPNEISSRIPYSMEEDYSVQGQPPIPLSNPG